LLTHYFVIVYYFFNAVVCLKIMYVTFNAAVVIVMFEMIFGDPRPYWQDSRIVATSCANSFGFPSFTVFCMIFIFMYSWHCFKEEDDEGEDSVSIGDIVKALLFLGFFGVYCFARVAAGIEYMSQVFLTVLYSVLLYYLATFFDKTITNLVEKSSIDVQGAKRYSIFWMVYLLIFSAVATITYSSTDDFLQINWSSNYLNCMEQTNQSAALQNTPYYRLQGPWGSFIQTGVLFAIMGAIFGSAKAFRDFKGVLWYDTSKRNKAIMTAIASLCILPSWLVIYFQPTFIVSLQQDGLDMYIVNALHLLGLYFMLFGVLPKYVFNKLGLLNKDSKYYFVEDEMIRIDSTVNL